MMVPSQKLQLQLFEEIKHKVSSKTALVSEIADVLNVSTDSAYRRLRGDTDLTLDEASVLCNKYQLSLDGLLNLSGNMVTFTNDVVAEESDGFNQHFDQLFKTAEAINTGDEKLLIYLAREIPVFHLFHLPSLISFKTYFWRKTVAGIPELKDALFSLSDSDDALMQVGRNILKEFVKIPTIEIINEEFLVSTFNQIEFCFESGYFKNPNEAFTLFDDLTSLILHMKKQAELGFKFLYGGNPVGGEGNYKLFHNEIIQTENMAYANIDGMEMAFLEHNVLSFLKTTNPIFCQTTHKMLERIMAKSQMISSFAERERNKFFNRILARLNKREAALNNMM